jgi:Zn-dependent protease
VAIILGGDLSRAAPVVSSFFAVKAHQKGAYGDTVEFLIQDSEVSGKFPAFLKELAGMGMIATAKRGRYVSRLMPTLSSTATFVQDGIIVTVGKMPQQQPSKRRLPIPIILFAATVAAVFIDGIYRSGSGFAQQFIQDPLMMAVIYTISLLGILGVHEMGHMIAAKKHGLRVSWPFFIPGFPGVWPTFGAMIKMKNSMTSRNVLFDVGISGPIAGLIITVVVSIYGSSISVLIPADQAQPLLDDNQLMPMRSSILMMLTMYSTGTASQDTVLVMSPVLFAAWIGFLITFLNLLPAWQLDGGHVTRAALGVRWHRILTYSSVGVLTGLGFYPMAFLVLLLSMRAPESTPLDDVTPLSKGRKALFAVAIALAVVTAPLPASFYQSWPF